MFEEGKEEGEMRLLQDLPASPQIKLTKNHWSFLCALNLRQGEAVVDVELRNRRHHRR